MGGSARKGNWRIEGQTTAIAVMGGCHLDLREAELEGARVTINAFAVMGGINVFVPDDVELDVSGFSFMGGRNVGSTKKSPPPGGAGRPRTRLLVHGRCECRQTSAPARFANT